MISLMRRTLRGWTVAAVLAGLWAGWGCGAGGPEPGMLKDPPKEPPGMPGMEAMKEMKKDPAKLRKLLEQAAKKSRAGRR